MTERLLSIDDAARRFGVSPSTVRRRIRSGEIRHFMALEGRRRRILVIVGAPASTVAETPASQPLQPARTSPEFPLPTHQGTAWALRHVRSYRWLLPMWTSGARFTDRLDEAHLFREPFHAELTARDLREPVEVYEVARIAA